MNSEQQELWSKIRTFDIDGGPAPFSFARRLAKENGWSMAYTNRVIEEYKRFVFLCMASGHACSPSDQVDQAWHLHLTYTESYWTRLNQQVLPKPLHHGPTKGGSEESAKFADWYRRTLDSYRGLFGMAPPSDIWASTGAQANWKRVDISRFWMIPKVSVTRGLAWAGILPLLGLGGLGCSYLAETTISPWVPFLIILGVVILIIVIACIAIAEQNKNEGKGNGSGSSCGSSGCGSSCGSSCGGGCGGGGD